MAQVSQEIFAVTSQPMGGKGTIFLGTYTSIPPSKQAQDLVFPPCPSWRVISWLASGRFSSFKG